MRPVKSLASAYKTKPIPHKPRQKTAKPFAFVIPDGSTVDLGHFDTADAATKAVQEYLEQQVLSGNISQEEVDDLLNNGSVE